MRGQYIQDEGSFNKYFHLMLNMADDDLGPYEYRLLGHYRRVCGDTGYCNEAIETTAKKCKMSVAKARATRRDLRGQGYIQFDDNANGVTLVVTVVDRMAENAIRYAKATKSDSLPDTKAIGSDSLIQEKATKSDSLGDRKNGHTPTKNDRGGLSDSIGNQEPYKKNHQEEDSSATPQPKHRARDRLYDLIMVRSFCGYPKSKSSQSLYNGQIVKVKKALVDEFFGKRKPEAQERAAFVREVRTAYRWHAEQRGKDGKLLHPCQSARAVVDMLKRYRQDRNQAPARPTETLAAKYITVEVPNPSGRGWILREVHRDTLNELEEYRIP